jgi:hypothetical protein
VGGGGQAGVAGLPLPPTTIPPARGKTIPSRIQSATRREAIPQDALSPILASRDLVFQCMLTFESRMIVICIEELSRKIGRKR